MFAKTLLIIGGLSISTPALAGHVEDFQAHLKFIQKQTDSGAWSSGLEQHEANRAYDILQLQLDHPFSWWFYIKDDVFPANDQTTSGSIPYKPSAHPRITLRSGSFNQGDIHPSPPGPELINAGLSAVQYEAQYPSENTWHVIGVSSDAADGFALDYDLTGFEPMFRTELLDASGAPIIILDSQGSDVTQAAVLAVAVPEPRTWAMIIAGMGLVGVALRRRRAVVVAT